MQLQLVGVLNRLSISKSTKVNPQNKSFSLLVVLAAIASLRILLSGLRFLEEEIPQSHAMTFLLFVLPMAMISINVFRLTLLQ